MSLTLRHQLTALDRALAHLLDERARLSREMVRGAPLPAPALEDVLARTAGQFPAPALKRVFEAVDEGCRRATEELSR
jgi:chorismate mutase